MTILAFFSLLAFSFLRDLLFFTHRQLSTNLNIYEYTRTNRVQFEYRYSSISLTVLAVAQLETSNECSGILN